VNRVGDRARLHKTHLGLLWVNVHVDQMPGKLQVNHAAGIVSSREALPVGKRHRRGQRSVSNWSLIDENLETSGTLARSVRSGKKRLDAQGASLPSTSNPLLLGKDLGNSLSA
jgi:hypothetical protein